MDKMKYEWLPHLSPEVLSEMKGNYLDAYVVALEGWRRGLKLKWHHKNSPEFSHVKTWFIDEPGQVFSLHSKTKSHYFFRTRGDKVSTRAVEQGMDKHFTKIQLSKSGIPVPKGKTFSKNEELINILSYINSIGYPVVLKPVDGSFGRGVHVKLYSEKEVKNAFNYIKNVLNEDVIVEEFIAGKDYRLYVIGNKVVGAILRVPPNIVGDGSSTIVELIEKKNNVRLLNPRLKDCLITVNEEMKKYLLENDYTVDDIPRENERVYLSEKANISIGGDPIDVLDELSHDIKLMAIRALQSIEGLKHGAVDVMVGTTTDKCDKAYVIELNPTAQIGGILFPIIGTSRDVPKEIIDYYFPETKREVNTSRLYFDNISILQPLMRGIATNVVTKTLEERNLIHRKYKLDYIIDINQYNLIKKEALNMGLNGKVLFENNIKTIILVSGIKESLDELEFLFRQSLKLEFDVIEIFEENIMTGFNIDKGTEYLIGKIEKQQELIHLNKKRLRKLNKEYKKLVNSTSWKITKPMRKIIAFINEKK